MIRRLADGVGTVVVGGAAIVGGVIVGAGIVGLLGAGLQLALESPTLLLVLVGVLVAAAWTPRAQARDARGDPEAAGPIGPIVSYPVRRSVGRDGSHTPGGGTGSGIGSGSHLSGGGTPPDFGDGSHPGGGGTGGDPTCRSVQKPSERGR